MQYRSAYYSNFDESTYRARRRNRGRRTSMGKIGPYILLKQLGEGTFGKVMLGFDPLSRNQVAIKIMRKEIFGVTHDFYTAAEGELRALDKLDHPHIVKLIGSHETTNHLALILEYVGHGTLHDLIDPDRPLHEDHAKLLFAQLVSSIKHMHENGIVHRDLKLENILLFDNFDTKIADFGFAKRFCGNSDLMETKCGTPLFSAPEQFSGRGFYRGRAADIWSCGIILYALVCGYLPFEDALDYPGDGNYRYLYDQFGRNRLTFPDFVSHEIRDLIHKMLKTNPRWRSPITAIIEHPWLSDYRSVLDGPATPITMQRRPFSGPQRIGSPVRVAGGNGIIGYLQSNPNPDPAGQAPANAAPANAAPASDPDAPPPAPQSAMSVQGRNYPPAADTHPEAFQQRLSHGQPYRTPGESSAQQPNFRPAAPHYPHGGPRLHDVITQGEEEAQLYAHQQQLQQQQQQQQQQQHQEHQQQWFTEPHHQPVLPAPQSTALPPHPVRFPPYFFPLPPQPFGTPVPRADYTGPLLLPPPPLQSGGTGLWRINEPHAATVTPNRMAEQWRISAGYPYAGSPGLLANPVVDPHYINRPAQYYYGSPNVSPINQRPQAPANISPESSYTCFDWLRRFC